MKVPLEQEPFASVALSREQEERLAWLSDALLDEALAENDDFVIHQQRVLDRAKWKHVMSRENVSIHKRVGKGELGGCTPDVSLREPGREPATKCWRVPVCVGTGTIPGSLDDLLYGVLAPTKLDTLIRTTYIKDESADARVLATVVAPSEDDPLRQLLVRWQLVFQFANSIGVITPRDTVNLESVGTRVLPNGERIGYVIMHSVDLPGCEELVRFGLIRALFSSAFIFRDTGTGSVEVFMRGFIKPGGRLGDGVAVFSVCISLIAIWRLVLAGQNKKLAFVARTGQFERATSQARKQDEAAARGQCPLCSRSNSGFRTLGSCDLCRARACRRCIDKRKLTHVKPSGGITRVSTRVCKTCITKAARINAADVAACEYVANSTRTVRINSTSSTASSNSTRSPEVSVMNQSGELTRDHSDTTTSTVSGRSSVRESDMYSSLSESSNSFSSEYSVDFTKSDQPPVATLNDHQLQLWIRMNQLRIAADETEQLMKQNVAVMEKGLRLTANHGGDHALEGEDVQR